MNDMKSKVLAVLCGFHQHQPGVTVINVGSTPDAMMYAINLFRMFDIEIDKSFEELPSLMLRGAQLVYDQPTKKLVFLRDFLEQNPRPANDQFVLTELTVGDFLQAVTDLKDCETTQLRLHGRVIIVDHRRQVFLFKHQSYAEFGMFTFECIIAAYKLSEECKLNKIEIMNDIYLDCHLIQHLYQIIS